MISVVVTHADGSMSIETMSRQEIEVGVDSNGDVSLSEEQAERMRRQLASAGVHAVHVHLLNNSNNNSRGTPIHANLGTDGAATGTAGGSDVGTFFEGGSRSSPGGGGRQSSPEEIKIAKSGPSGNGHGRHDDGCFGDGEAAIGFDHGLLR